MTQQLDMFGPPQPAQDLQLTPHQKAEMLLDKYAEARDDDRLLTLLWWQEFDNLGSLFHWTLRDLLHGEVGEDQLEVMAKAMMERFETWFRKTATHPETIRRRRQEIQSNSQTQGAMRGSPTTTAYRRSRDGAGPPRR